MDWNTDIRNSKSGQLRVARRLFVAGFFLLPWLWCINAVYFAPYLRHPRTPTAVKYCTSLACARQRHRVAPSNSDTHTHTHTHTRAADTVLSMVGFVVEVAALVAWYCLYYANWSSWGLWAEQMLIVMPK